MNENSPEVSIVLPVYNGAKYIKQSIDSCLNQTYKNIELIVVDDCSTDETPEIIKSYVDERIKYIKHDTNQGLPHSLNTGFAKATGEYLTWTSDDNYYAEDALEKMLHFLKSKKCEFIYCDFYRFNDEKPFDFNIVKLPDVLTLGDNNDVGACILYSKKVRGVIGDYDANSFLAEDYDYWIRVSKKFSMFHFAEALYYYREHKGSLSISRFYEVKVVSILVRIKNEVLNIDPAVDYLVVLIAQKYPRHFRINRIISKILFSKKIKKNLRNFKAEKIDFKEAKLALTNIVAGDSFVQH